MVLILLLPLPVLCAIPSPKSLAGLCTEGAKQVGSFPRRESKDDSASASKLHPQVLRNGDEAPTNPLVQLCDLLFRKFSKNTLVTVRNISCLFV